MCRYNRELWREFLLLALGLLLDEQWIARAATFRFVRRHKSRLPLVFNLPRLITT